MARHYVSASGRNFNCIAPDILCLSGLHRTLGPLLMLSPLDCDDAGNKLIQAMWQHTRCALVHGHTDSIVKAFLHIILAINWISLTAQWHPRC